MPPFLLHDAAAAVVFCLFVLPNVLACCPPWLHRYAFGFSSPKGCGKTAPITKASVWSKSNRAVGVQILLEKNLRVTLIALGDLIEEEHCFQSRSKYVP